MDVIKYVQTAFKLWIFDQSAANEVKEKEFPIMLGLLILVVIGLATSILTIFQEILIPSDDSLLLLVGLPLSYISILVAIPMTMLSILILSMFILWSHLWIKIFKGSQGLKKTFETFILVVTPSNMISLILTILGFIITISFRNSYSSIVADLIVTVLGLFLFVYYLIIVIKTISIIHDLDIGKTILAGVCSVMVAFILLIALMLVLLIPLAIIGAFTYM